MKKQDYSNHVRYYIPHHFIFYPLALGLIIFSIRCIFIYPSQSTQWIIILASIVLLTWLSFMMRQHYALICQNRIVRLELRFRYFTITGERLELLEDRLSFSQLAALRFASDEELSHLVKRAVEEALSPGQIKKSIKNWLPDTFRV
jgi:hypothetical protein